MSCRITIGIPTLRRNADLRELLPLLIDQAAAVETLGDYRAQVVVVDNDPAGGAAAVVRPLEREAPVTYLHEPRPGLAAVRNAALAAASTSRLLAFMDDDGRPDEGWLVELVRTWERTGASAVAGRVVERYETPPPEWIVAGEFFRRFSMPTLTPVPVAPTGNLLLDLDQVRAFGLRFDDRFGASGGEDTLFTTELTRAGGRIVWCEESRVLDVVPASRMTRGWVLARARSQGTLAVRVAHTVETRPGHRLAVRAGFAARGAARVGAGGLRAAYGRVRGDVPTHAQGLRTAHRGLGMIIGSVTARSQAPSR